MKLKLLVSLYLTGINVTQFRDVDCMKKHQKMNKKKGRPLLANISKFSLIYMLIGACMWWEFSVNDSELTRGVSGTPALSQSQRAAAPRGGGLGVGETRWGPGRGRGAARALRNLPQLMGQRGLALSNGPRGPGRLHFSQFTFTFT